MRMFLEDGKKSPIFGGNFPLSETWEVPPGSNIVGVKFTEF